jgi:hypothetical protein
MQKNFYKKTYVAGLQVLVSQAHVAAAEGYEY